MARTYGQSNSLGTQNGQPTSALPPYRARMLKALKRPKRAFYNAKPSAYAIGPPPVRPPVADIQYPILNPAPIIDEPTMEEAYIPDPNFTLPMREAPVLAPPMIAPTGVGRWAGPQRVDDPEMMDVEINGKIYRVPRPLVGPKPPHLETPGLPPLISEPGVQQSRNRGGQMAGAFAALASLLGGDPGFIGENLPAVMAQGIAGGEQGALDRYGREVNNYNATTSQMDASNAVAMQDWQNQNAYTDDINKANNLPNQLASDQIEVENQSELRRIQRLRAEQAKAGLEYKISRDSRKDFQDFFNRFTKLSPEAREDVLSNAQLLAGYGIDEPFEVEALRGAKESDFRDPTFMTRIGQQNINKAFELLSDKSIDPVSRERVFQSIAKIAGKYDIDLSDLPDKIDALDMTPAEKQRLHIQMLNYQSIAGYRSAYVKYLNALLGERAKDRDLRAYGLFNQIWNDAQGDEDRFFKNMSDAGLAVAMFEDNPQIAKGIIQRAQKAISEQPGTPEATNAARQLEWMRKNYPKFFPGAVPPPGNPPPVNPKNGVPPPQVPTTGQAVGSTKRGQQMKNIPLRAKQVPPKAVKDAAKRATRAN